MTTAFISYNETAFEGLNRPLSLMVLRDDGTVDYQRNAAKGMAAAEEGAILTRYFGDVQNLFLKKFALFAGSDGISEQESHKRRALLEEMIKVKARIGGSERTSA